MHRVRLCSGAPLLKVHNQQLTCSQNVTLPKRGDWYVCRRALRDNHTSGMAFQALIAYPSAISPPGGVRAWSVPLVGGRSAFVEVDACE